MEARYSGNTYLLVRHGEALTNVMGVVSSKATTAGAREYPLTSRGRLQIAETAEWLSDKGADFIVASPVLRARETAEIIADTLHLPLSFDARLCEPNFGTFEGKDFRDFLDFMAEHGTRAVGAPELGIEGYMDIRERVRSFLGSVSEAFAGKKIIIVSHADTLQELYAELLGEPIGAEQGEGHWFPEKGCCLIVDPAGTRVKFQPQA